MATPRGLIPTGTVATTVLVDVAITETVPSGPEARIHDIGVFPIRGDGDPNGLSPHRDDRRPRGVGRVDHKDPVLQDIRHIGVFPIRVMATPLFPSPSSTPATTVLLAVSITKTLGPPMETV
jgi:hypothetical protein